MCKSSGQVNNYHQAVFFLGNRKSRKIAPNTTVVKVGEKYIAIKLYNTDIIAYFPDGKHRINTGGFCTQLTVQRLNQFGPKGWKYSKEGDDLISTYLGEIGKGHKK